MECPYCGHENIPGVDVCADCNGDLTAFDEPSGESALEDSLLHEPVLALNPKDAVMVSPEMPVKEAIATMQDRNIGCVLVGTESGVEGIFSERDALLKIADRESRVASRPVSDFMTSDPEILEQETPIVYALNRMALGDFRHLPLTQGGRLAGIISLRDFLAFLHRWYPDLAEAP